MDIASMIEQVLGLADAINAKVATLPTIGTDLANATASAQAANTSAGSAAAQQSAAGTSATTAATKATAASGSASAASSSAAGAAGSATTAATQATNAGTSASAASTSASNASGYNSSAQGYNNRVQSLQQVSPAASAGPTTTGVANGTWNCTVSFTAPCNGWIFAVGSFNLYQPSASGYICSLYIDGGYVAGDTTSESQRHMGSIYVSAGTAVTVNMQAVSQSTAPGQGGTLHVVAFFIPAAA